MKKYYINRQEDRLLVDGNENTPYLAQKGYEEISKEEYDAVVLQHAIKEKNILRGRRSKWQIQT